MAKKLLFFAMMLMTSLAQAQEGTSDVEGGIATNDTWYGSPWLWIVGAAMFIILLVALTKGKRD
jgi:hypothetical protein